MKTKNLTPAFYRPQWRAIAARHLLSWVAAFGVVLGEAGSLQAQPTTNTWNGAGTLWGTASDWTPANVPNSVDSMVVFTNTTQTISAPSSSTTYTIGTLNLAATTATMGFAGANLVLNFQTSSGTPVINCSGGAGLYWYFTTTGAQGFTKLGGGTLTGRYSSVVNSGLTGPIIIGQGLLQLNQAGSLGNASSVTISNASSGLQLDNTAGTTTTGFDNVYTIMPPFQTVHLEGGGTPVISSAQVGGTLAILGNVQTASGSALYYKGTGQTILAGTNNFVGNSTVSGGTLFLSTTTTNNGTLTVSANATNGVIATSPGSSMVVSSLNLVGTNNSVLAFGPGLSGLPTVPMLYVTNNLTFVTNVPAQIVLSGGNWQVGSDIPLLQYGTLINTNPQGVFQSFALGALPAGFTAALANGTSTNQIDLNLTAITPLVWAPPASGSNNWTTNTGVWSLGGTGGQTYKEVNLLGPSVQFDDSLTPAGPNIMVTNNAILSPNNVVFNNSTHNYTLLGSGAIANYAGITKSGTGYLTNSLGNYYFGNTVLNGGVMVLNNATALGYGSTVSFNGGALQFTANNKVDYSGQFSTAANQAYALNLGGQSIALSNALSSSGGSLTVSNTGTLLLTAANTYSGATINNGGILKLGIANALPTTTTLTLATSGNSATLDLAGFNQTLAGLAMGSGANAAIITNGSKVNPVTLTYNGGSSGFAGSIVDGTANGANGGQSVALTVAGGSLTLTGANTYTNTTTITSGGQLYLGSGGSITSTNVTVNSGSLLDVSAVSYATHPGGSLNGIGNVNGNVEIVGLSVIQPDAFGAAGNHGTLTLTNNLQLDQYAACNLNVAATHASASNDHIAVLGQLYANDPNGNILNLQGPGAGNLDTTADYTLISAPNNTIAGSFNPIPNWVGTKPANYAHYTVVTSANAVTLHYAVGISLSGAGTVSPATGPHQNYLFTVTVTPGTGSTGIGVTADFTTIGGSAQTFSSVGNLFSYTNAVPGSVTPGTYSVPFTVTDAQSDIYNGIIIVIIANGTLVWDGAAVNNDWDSQNWLNGAVPDVSGDAGDALVFAGGTGLYPLMDNSFNVTSVTFSNNATTFNITNVPGYALTLAASGTVENDSPNAEFLEVPVNLTSGSRFNTPAGNLIVGPLGASSDGFTKNGSGKLIIDGTNATSSYSGTTTLAGGTLAITNADNTLPTGTTVAYTAPATLDLGGHNQSVANLNLSALTAGTATVTNGNLTATGTSLNFSPFTNTTAVTTVDLSGLSTLTYSAGTIYFDGSLGASSTLKLAQTNFLTANELYLANGGLTAEANNTAAILLGQTNLFNLGNIQFGGYHNAGSSLAFNTGWNQPTLTLRGFGGPGTAVGNFYIGDNNNGICPPSTFDTTGGSFDAIVNNCYIVYNNSTGGAGTLSVSNGTFNAGTIYMAYDNGGTTSTSANATVNQNGGTVLVGTLGLNYNTSTGLPAVTSTYNLGNGTNGSGLLSASIITIGATQPITNSTAKLNFNNGTIENYEPTNSQSDGLGVAVGGSSSQQNLDLSGQAGGGATNSSLTLNIILAATGAHNFYAESGYTITEESSVLISGSGGLTANGPGLVTLLGTNTYTGNTTVSAGTLELAQPYLSWRSSVSVSNGAALQLDFAVTNQVAALVINGVSQAPDVYNSTTTPTYITGAGSLLVAPLSTNAYLTSLALNPADSLTPNFATNLLGYYATNGYETSPTLTVTNGNPAASNVLILNGLTFQVLSSGVPSRTLTLGAGATNVLQVLVTAQDGVTTKLYTVDVTQLTVSTNAFAITNSVSGGNLILSWPANHLGWRLEVQTNSAGAGLGTNWFTWPNSTNETSVSIPLNPANPSVFLRMIYP